MADSRQAWQIPQTDYHAYLLRLWRENPSGSWRALVQDAATGERHGFAGLASLMRFLWAQTEAHLPSEGEVSIPRTPDPEETDWA